MYIYDGKLEWPCDRKAPMAFVYRNLTNRCWSVRISGRVVIHAEVVVLEDAEFRVNENGRQRVLQQQRKNVHAGVRGRVAYAAAIDVRRPIWGMHWRPLREDESFPFLLDGRGVTYNPYAGPSFTLEDDGTAIERAQRGERVLLDQARQVKIGVNLI